MPQPPLLDRLAVCSWSLEPETPDQLVDRMHRIGLTRLQLELDPLREGGAWLEAAPQLRQGGLEAVGGMMRCVGEDYSTLESIRRTGGVVPDDTWPQSWANIQKMVPIAAELGLPYVMFHAGFVPHDPADPDFEKVVGRVRQVADAMAAAGMELGLETGQEDAPTLLQFLTRLERPNVKVNFDPANMILYDKGDPIDALRTLSAHLGQVHIKDGRKTQREGYLGDEVVVGTGQVDWSAFFGVLNEVGFEGFLAIEREAGDDRVGDIRTAKEYVLRVAGGG